MIAINHYCSICLLSHITKVSKNICKFSWWTPFHFIHTLNQEIKTICRNDSDYTYRQKPFKGKLFQMHDPAYLFIYIYISRIHARMRTCVMFASLTVALNQVEICRREYTLINYIWSSYEMADMGWLRKNIPGTINCSSPGIFNDISKTLRKHKVVRKTTILITVAYSYVYSAIQLAHSPSSLVWEYEPSNPNAITRIFIFSCYCPNSWSRLRWRWR